MMPWEDEVDPDPPPLLVETGLSVEATFELKVRLWRRAPKGMVWEGHTSGPRSDLSCHLGRAALGIARTLNVECPPSLTQWLGGHRTQSFSAFAHRAEGLASRVDTARLEHFSLAMDDDPRWPAAHISLAAECHIQGMADALPKVISVLADLNTKPWDWLDLAATAHAVDCPEVAREAMARHDALCHDERVSPLVEQLRTLIATPSE
jgi:hypothetical protein